MGEVQRQDGPAVGEKSPEQIRREIEATREELGETVEALAAKTDVKARAKEKVDDVKATVAEKTGGVRDTVAEKTQSFKSSEPGSGPSPVTQVTTTAKENPIPTAAIAAFVGGFLIGRLTAR